jgi:hypothetical protein
LLSGPEQVLAQFFNAVANLLHTEFSRSEVFVELLKSTIALFVVLNPIGTVPLFIGITQNIKKGRTKSSFGYNYIRYRPSSVRNSW